MAGYGFCGAGVNTDGQFASNSWFVARQAENVSVMSKHGELQLLLRGVTRERFIKCCGLVVGQIAVGGSGCYLAIK
uniref:Uncharacterized protein n=1 Tax=Romanomermis culicivorax TaxID=13658 RepID=A0A915L695_ROMCU